MNSFHLLIFLYICLHDTELQCSIPLQVILELVHSGFQAAWNSRSGTEFHSGIMQLKISFVLDWKSQIV